MTRLEMELTKYYVSADDGEGYETDDAADAQATYHLFINGGKRAAIYQRVAVSANEPRDLSTAPALPDAAGASDLDARATIEQSNDDRT